MNRRLLRVKAGAARARDLDLGCGAGEPIARYLIDAGCRVTGVDASSAMVALCSERFLGMDWSQRI
jgi:cyclopropane fatty-acyl-phospholipid synthase-like methyltransferase